MPRQVPPVAIGLARAARVPTVCGIATRRPTQERTMVSRLTAYATVFAVIATASLAVAAASLDAPQAHKTAAVQPVPVVHLERVQITVKRHPRAVGAGSN
jgi:hypothetical protein